MFLYSGLALGLQILSFFPWSVTASPYYPKSKELNNRQTCTNSATDRSCWGDYDLLTNYYDTVPDTGVTREYWLEITNTTLAPDGVERIVLAVNGTVPGPTIEADWGDTVIVHVTNSLTNNGTSIHFHGVRQNNTVQMDGVISVTQCPTAPGDSYTYTWRATQYGTSWYHSHYSLQAWDGVFGGIVINGPTTANYDVDLGNLFIQDWDHVTASAQWDYALYVGPPTQTTGLINGTNVWEGAGSYFEQTFVSGTSYRFRIVNSAIDTFFKFSIDNHTMTVVSMDFVPIEPFETTILSMGIGQRYDVIVNASEPTDDYWMRAIPQVTCSNNDNVDGILGIVRYDASSTADPTTTGYNYTDSCDDMPLASLVPYLPLDPGSETIEEDLEVAPLADTTTGVVYWNVAGSSLDLDWSNPTLLQVYDNATTFGTSQNVYQVAAQGDWTYVILEQTSAPAHPIHLHGHDFYVLAQGVGTYASAAPTLLTTNPPRRDVMMLPPEGYLVLAFKADNPGTWLMHCHIGFHQSLGLALQFVAQESEISALVDSTALNDNCANWDAYLSASGLIDNDDGI